MSPRYEIRLRDRRGAVSAEPFADVEVCRAGSTLLLAGVVLFSGSLYALAISGVRMLGAVTPFGGLAFIAAWVLLAYWLLTPP